MKYILLIIVAFLTIISPILASANIENITSISSIMAEWAKSLDKTLIWEAPLEYDYKITNLKFNSQPKSNTELKQLIKDLNQFIVDSGQPDAKQALVICIRSDYIAVRLNNKPTQNCP